MVIRNTQLDKVKTTGLIIISGKGNSSFIDRLDMSQLTTLGAFSMMKHTGIAQVKLTTVQTFTVPVLISVSCFEVLC